MANHWKGQRGNRCFCFRPRQLRLSAGGLTETVGYLSLKGGTVTLPLTKTADTAPQLFRTCKGAVVTTQEIDRDGASVNDVSESLIMLILRTY